MNIDVSQLTGITNKIVINKKVVPDVLNALGDIMLALIRQRAPRESGTYVAGWRKEVKGNSVKVFNRDRQLYVILEFGTNPHRIEPNNAQALYFDGEFYTSVNHSGGRAFPHLRPAITRIKQLIPEIVKAKVALNSPILKGISRNLYPERKYISGNTRGGGNDSRANPRVKGSTQ